MLASSTSCQRLLRWACAHRSYWSNVWPQKPMLRMGSKGLKYFTNHSITLYENYIGFYEEIQKTDVFLYITVKNGIRTVCRFKLKPSQRGLSAIPSEVVDLYNLLYETAHHRFSHSSGVDHLQRKPRRDDSLRARPERGFDSNSRRNSRRRKRSRLKTARPQ